MSFAFPSIILIAALTVSWAEARELRVCADPDNLPLSHADESGFENRIARLVARDMNAELRYTWLAQIRGYVRKTMGEGLCDLFIGVPTGLDRLTTTRPYYRSAYVFVDSPSARGLETFDDERLRDLRIGVQLPGPGSAFAMHGYVDNVRGFPVLGDGPSAQRMIGAVARGDLDTALVWGPQAGYFAARAAKPLEVRKAAPPFEFDIAMGVRRGDTALRDELNAILEKRRADIDAILAAYAVPRTDLPR